MANQKSFKERVKDTLIQCAGSYKNYYVDYEYLICSSAFSNYSYYIVSAHEDNFLHLTGVHTNLDAAAFFSKCNEGMLQAADFDFCKNGQTESEVKGSVRRKIKVLPLIMNLFTCGTFVEEDFHKNRIRCALAAGTVNVTLGFVVTGKAKPMTLLKGNELDSGKAKPIDLVLRRKSDCDKFTDIVAGDIKNLKNYKESLNELLSEELLTQISD